MLSRGCYQAKASNGSKTTSPSKPTSQTKPTSQSPPAGTEDGPTTNAGNAAAMAANAATDAVANPPSDAGNAAVVQAPGGDEPATDANVIVLRDTFKAKKFTTMLRSGTLHPVHKEAYDELAKKNGGHSFSVQPAW